MAGLALSLGLAVDAVADPFIGTLSDGWHSRFGRRLPFMIVGLPVLAISLVLIFSLPAGMSQHALFAAVLGLSTVLRIAMSLYILPFVAFGAELSDDYGERSRIVAWRWGCSMLSGFASVAIGFGIFFRGDHGTLTRSAYTPFAFTCAALMVVLASISLNTNRRLRHRTHIAAVRTHGSGRSLIIALGEVFRNSSFVILVSSTLLLFVAQGVTIALGLHANIYFWKLSGNEIKLVTLSLFVGLLVGAPFFAIFGPRFEKRSMLVISLIALTLTETVPTTLRLAGLLPYAPEQLAMVVGFATFLAGITLCAAAISVTSMLADAADEHEYLFGRRREGLYFAGWTFAAKAAGGVGALISGLVLQLSGFPSGGATAGAPLVLQPETVRAIGIAYGPGAAIFSLAGAFVLLFYKLDLKRHAMILSELAIRRESES